MYSICVYIACVCVYSMNVCLFTCAGVKWRKHLAERQDLPLHPQILRPAPANKSHRYCVHEYRPHVACAHPPHSPTAAVHTVTTITPSPNPAVPGSTAPHLYTKLPSGSHRNSGNRTVVVGGNDGTFFSTTHTRHSLQHTNIHIEVHNVWLV